MSDLRSFDCIVLGGGPAGLSAALLLARYRWRVLLFHHNSPRNIYSHGVHGFLGHHGIQPAELLKIGRAEVIQHGAEIIEATVNSARQLESGRFCIQAEGLTHAFECERLVLATGLRDLTPDCPGFREFYGVSVHQCPECDGFEIRDKRVAIYGLAKDAVTMALGMLTWTDRIVLVAENSNEITGTLLQKVRDAGIHIVNGRIARLEGDFHRQQLQQLRLDNGDVVECDAMFFTLGSKTANDFHTALGCRMDEEGLICVDDKQETSTKGVYAVGDITARSHLAVVAAAKGAMAAIQIHKSLVPQCRRAH